MSHIDIRPSTHTLEDALEATDKMDLWGLMDWNDDLQDLMERLPEEVRETVLKTWREMVKEDFRANDEFYPHPMEPNFDF